MDLVSRRRCGKAAVVGCYDALPPNELGEAHDALGDEVGMLDQHDAMGNHAGISSLPSGSVTVSQICHSCSCRI